MLIMEKCKKKVFIVITQHARQRFDERNIAEALVFKVARLHCKRKEILVISPVSIQRYGYSNITKYLMIVVAKNCVITAYWKSNMQAVRDQYQESRWRKNSLPIRFVS